jgi:P63C domain
MTEKVVSVEIGTVPHVTHGSPTRPLRIGDVEIPCYVLSDGRRVLVNRGMVSALGMSKGRAGGGGDRLTAFTRTKAIEPFIDNELRATIEEPIRFKAPNGKLAFGYEATILADICNAVLRGRDAGLLLKQQQHIAVRCEILLRSFAKVGIIALVDEATGYQADREQEALQKLLELYIAKDLVSWAKMFPDEFYKEIFRLRGWDWQSTGGKRPKFVGKLTNHVVYERLPPEVVEELRQKSPPGESGQRRVKLFQWLNLDFGQPVLKTHIIGVLALMRAASDWARFDRMLERSYPKPGRLQTEMELQDRRTDE